MKQLLLLIDGSGFIFRAYHKLPPLNRPDGTPTGAVYGFCAMLLKLREELPASHMVVVFDAKGENFRHKIAPNYKANRPPAPEDLVPQFPLVRLAAEALNMAIVEQSGFEADDIIATYANIAAKNGMEACVVSSDKDLMQLLAFENISLYDPLKTAYITPDDVFKKFGATPAQVVDIQAIMGDSTDNIAGIKGIGAKGAAELIEQFGNVENLIARTHEISQKRRRELVESQVEELLISKKLVSLKDDCEGLPEIATFAAKPIDAAMFATFCDEMNFKTLKRRVDLKYGEGEQAQTENAIAIRPRKREYKLIQTLADLRAIIAQIEHVGTVAFDVETTSLDAMQANLVGISLCCEEGVAYYVPIGHKFASESEQGLFAEEITFADAKNSELNNQIPLADVLSVIKPMLISPAILKIGHNIKYDMQVMARYGVNITPVTDTMLISYVLNAGKTLHNMDSLAENILQIKTVKYGDVVGKGVSKKCFSEISLQAASDYAAEDADVTWQLYQALRADLIAAHNCELYETIERPIIGVVQRMEARGVKINPLFLNELSRQFNDEMQLVAGEIYKLAGEEFNIASPKQLGEILFEKLKIEGAKGKKSSKTGAYVTDAETLEDLAGYGNPLPAKILEWRQLAKLKSTYTDSLPKQINGRTGRVHTSYSLAATSTGRLSSNEPNLQNIPIRTAQGRQIRKAFIAEDGFKLLCADYSQIELRLLAHIADIAPLKQAFADGIDVHKATASQVFGVAPDEVDFEMRRKAKTINFGIIYGISAHGLAARLNIPRTLAAEYIELYFKQYGGIAQYMENCRENAKQNGYVETLWGRKCHLPMIHDKNAGRRAFAQRAAINAPLQGSAADIIKLAMIAVDDLLIRTQAKTRMLLQVHDELIFELASGEDALIPKIQQTMQNVAHLSVPLLVEVGVGENWADAH